MVIVESWLSAPGEKKVFFYCRCANLPIRFAPSFFSIQNVVGSERISFSDRSINYANPLARSIDENISRLSMKSESCTTINWLGLNCCACNYARTFIAIVTSSLMSTRDRFVHFHLIVIEGTSWRSKLSKRLDAQHVQTFINRSPSENWVNFAVPMHPDDATEVLIADRLTESSGSPMIISI